MKSKINYYLCTEGTGNRQDQNKVVQPGIHGELREKSPVDRGGNVRREGFTWAFLWSY